MLPAIIAASSALFAVSSSLEEERKKAQIYHLLSNVFVPSDTYADNMDMAHFAMSFRSSDLAPNSNAWNAAQALLPFWPHWSGEQREYFKYKKKGIPYAIIRGGDMIYRANRSGPKVPTGLFEIGQTYYVERDPTSVLEWDFKEPSFKNRKDFVQGMLGNTRYHFLFFTVDLNYASSTGHNMKSAWENVIRELELDLEDTDFMMLMVVRGGERGDLNGPL